MKYSPFHILLLGAALLAGCTASVPEQYSEAGIAPTVYPDYSDGITIPYNIAPLNFAYTMEGEKYVTELKAGEQSLVVKGKQTDWDIKKWHTFLDNNKGRYIEVNAYVQTDNGWQKYRPITWRVAEEPVDPYISYRIIAPSYVTYEELSIRQRELGTFDELIAEKGYFYSLFTISQ